MAGYARERRATRLEMPQALMAQPVSEADQGPDFIPLALGEQEGAWEDYKMSGDHL